jgi:hypothetical protein
MEENKHMKHKRMEIVVVFIVTFLMAFLYLSGMPFCLLEMSIKNKDILFNNAFYVVNTFFLSILTIILTKVITKNWVFGFTVENLTKNILDKGKVFLMGIIVVLILSIINYKPLDRMPSFGEIFIWVLFC